MNPGAARIIDAEFRAEQAEKRHDALQRDYETLLIRWREAQEALRATTAALEVMRASHTPRKRMAAQERPDGLYEYRPQNAEDMA